MRRELKGIMCKCATNYDLCGIWKAEDVNKELEDVMPDVPDSEWLSYILGHLFSDYEGWTSELENVVVSDMVRDIRIALGDDIVHITKLYC